MQSSQKHADVIRSYCQNYTNVHHTSQVAWRQNNQPIDRSAARAAETSWGQDILLFVARCQRRQVNCCDAENYASVVTELLPIDSSSGGKRGHFGFRRKVECPISPSQCASPRKMMRGTLQGSLMLMFSIAGVSGCKHDAPIPTLRPIAKISAQVRDVPEFGLTPIDRVEVPDEHLSSFAKLITPTKPCLQNINSSTNYRVADVTIHHTDGTETTLIVRWTGANPAAISLDDRNFYYGGRDAFPDGATRIVRLLAEYKYESSFPDERVGGESP